MIIFGIPHTVQVTYSFSPHLSPSVIILFTAIHAIPQASLDKRFPANCKSEAVE